MIIIPRPCHSIARAARSILPFRRRRVVVVVVAAAAAAAAAHSSFLFLLLLLPLPPSPPSSITLPDRLPSSFYILQQPRLLPLATLGKCLFLFLEGVN